MNAPLRQSDTIRVDVDFYDAAEQAKLLTYPTASRITDLVSDGFVEISKAEFLTYYLFHHIKVGKQGYSDYQSVSGQISKWLAPIEDCLEINEGTVRTPAGAKQQLTEVSEHVGEAIGLAIVNRIHGLTEADWSPIPEQRGRSAKPSFDFQIASDGSNFVQLEAKGSSVQNNRFSCNAVKAQKRKIETKKATLALLGPSKQDPYPASLRYGTITAVDARKENNVRCLLTDPPGDQIDEEPRRFQLLSRSRFLRDWISFLSPRSPLAAAMATRVADMEQLEDPFLLDGIPLHRGNGDPFTFTPFSPFHWRHSSFMATKSRVADGPAGGVVVQLSKRALFLLGIREDLLTITARQNFGRISDYKAETGTEKKTVQCTVSSGRYQSFRLPPSVKEATNKVSGYVHFDLSGELHYSPEGLVFGILPLPEQ